MDESLLDNRLLNGLEIVKLHVSGQEDPSDRWHLFTVKCSHEQIRKISGSMKSGWYMNFWKDRSMIVVFRDRSFEFNYDDKSAWKPAIDYGLSIGIPKDQLDFLIE